MLTTNKPNELSIDQLQAILNNDHIRQHLVQVGYIDHRGNIIRKDEDNGHSRRPHTAKSKQSYPTSTPNQQHPMGNITNSNGQVGTQLPNDRRLKSASTVQSKRTNKSHASTRFSSLNQSTYVHNVLLRRDVSPKILPANNRCLVTFQYYGPDLNIEYDRDWFEPNGDEILIMQQHCGGENFLVFKGFLKPNEIFSFQSRRHTDYPFALAFYVNGIIKNRLSVCCESRCKNCMRIGGRRCLFAVIKVEKGVVCRRCRFQERMKKLIEKYPQSPAAADRRRRQKSKKTRTSSSKSPASPTKNSKTTATPESNSESVDIDRTSLKPTQFRKPSPEPIVSPKKSAKINGVRPSSPQELESGKSSPEPSAPRTKNFKVNTALKSSSQQLESGTSSPEPSAPRTKNSKVNTALKSSPEQVESGTSSPEPTVPRTKNSKALVVDTSGSEDRHESSTPIRARSATISNHQPQATNASNSYVPDFEEPEKKIHSSKSNSRKNKPPELSSSDSSADRPNIQQRLLPVPRKHDSDDEIASDDSNPDFQRFLAGANRRQNTDN